MAFIPLTDARQPDILYRVLARGAPMPFDQLKRREVITLLGGAALAWPLAAQGQQPAMPVIGFLNGVSFGGALAVAQAAAIRQGLRETGYVEGQNVAIEYRSADGEYDRLPALAAELVREKVAVIIAVGSSNPPRAAKAVTSTIPIVFAVGSDPVATGLVTNLRRPEANLTGVTFNNTALVPKRMEIARELLPGATSIGYLRNSTNLFDTDVAELTAAARTLGLRLSVFTASTDRELLTVFQSMAQQQLPALIVSTDATFNARRNQIAALAGHHGIPAIYSGREYVLAGGLISYSTEVDSLHRQAGIYTGRILKGDKPSDLPVVLPTKFELVINSKAAKELGLTVPVTLLTRADEVIE
jgi:putative tryptophan/tyrosine transport system substrate-binding protein